jgi:hypothetical protein
MDSPTNSRTLVGEEKYSCSCVIGSDVDGFNLKYKKINNRNKSNAVFAEENSETYTITSDGVLSPSKDGLYDLEIPGHGTYKDIQLYESEDYTFYDDSNGNGKMDDGEKIDLNSVVDVKVNKESDLFTYTFKSGYNFVSFPFISENMGSYDFIKYLNEQLEKEGANVLSIARFYSGSFEVTEYRSDIEENPVGDEFPISPGWGYVVKVIGSEENTVTLEGQEVVDSVELVFPHEGWYLSGVHGSSKSYTAESLIDSANEVEGLTVDNVTRWYTSTAKYEGLQKEKDEDGNSEVYGFDFAIEENKSYFVRVSELEDEEARWKP